MDPIAPNLDVLPEARKSSLKVPLILIGIIVVLIGSILGMIGLNRPTLDTTSSASGGKWPYGALPNVMLETNTLRVDTDESTGLMSIHGNIIFAKHLSSGAESWVVWASTDTKGKKNVGTTFPKGNNQLFPPKPPFPNPGTFRAGSGYPAEGTRVFGPAPKENEGTLKNNSESVQKHYFDIYDISIQKDVCTIYLNYRSNRQGASSLGNSSPLFFEITLPACLATPTPSRPVPTPTNVPLGCQYVRTFQDPVVNNRVNNYLNCRDFCGTDKQNGFCEVGSSAQCTQGACRAAKDNTGRNVYGTWYCCVRASCGKTCTPQTADSDCSAGLACLPKKCEKGVGCIQTYTCQDVVGCAQAGSCQCTDQVGVYPTEKPTP
ncbi:hypothetical protein A3D80_02280 [Candidatus Roizmanbacteria bacterium RIFCSPHIGHO2_02_FULL_40_13b]|uniref:Uncharacterized protein n=1 Tax=Candidatus Roizmanbacteria bacterium RIFCSPHIGHO2_01_FULL_39_24 TaxID=1802032 RepID=A0A1F7GJX2_9BACT|nr:MAG: hypothetical protein A2799_00025 [Candidatus Roizmanbacteria bacterium RIFCSPHIGHO2_01_FULL_39_24]OGK26657.1 MAG: hypothetical protein A3D80_02280 [Candidatus Roizmanbacteria bacterium RIFCSPHIGHO2_02_FULL_40_13b]OGK50105.1 MAG: hypothetical protein A3A56_04065 [Candidatus Roizmanbacteria bacterium RIFCSPLOWO2_01_FULL_40_32]OGK55908.1 MAG: hypothetical protein A3H83_02300 [Candidatus Roizmanbacteria bacterium RIFCSPLOWO2_02_FULL_39_8]